MMLRMMYGFTLSAAGAVMCVDTESIDGILHGTETLEQNYVPPGSRTESNSSLSFSCSDREGALPFCKSSLKTIIGNQRKRVRRMPTCF